MTSRPDPQAGWCGRWSSILALPVVVLLSSVGCGQGEPPSSSGERWDSAGVEIVSHTKSDRPLPWRFEPRFTLGSAVSGPDQFHRIDENSVAFDSLGRLYVLDAGNHRILAFDRSGKHLRTFGAEGEGPGQLTYPVSIWVDGGEVRILDRARGAIVRYAPDGTPLEDLSVRTLGFGRRVRPSGGGLVVRREVGFRSSVDSVTQQVLFIEEADTVVLAELRRAAPQRVTFEGCPRFRIDLDPIFNPEAIWNASAERVGTHTSRGYRVDVFEGTRLALSIRREMETRVTEDDALEEARQLGGVRLANRSCEFDPEEQLRKRGWVETLQPVGRIVIAEDGSIWARRNAVGGEEGPIDVFAADGSYLGTLDEEAPFPMAFSPEGAFVAKHVDDLGVERLTMYEIRRGDAGR